MKGPVGNYVLETLSDYLYDPLVLPKIFSQRLRSLQEISGGTLMKVMVVAKFRSAIKSLNCGKRMSKRCVILPIGTSTVVSYFFVICVMLTSARSLKLTLMNRLGKRSQERTRTSLKSRPISDQNSFRVSRGRIVSKISPSFLKISIETKFSAL